MSVYEDFHNVKIKSYPSGAQKYTIASYPLFRDISADGSNSGGGDAESESNRSSKPKKKAGEATRDDSAKRSRDKAWDIAMINEWTHFITWTYSLTKIDRYNDTAIKNQLRNYLHNMSKRRDLRYLAIPEYHKDKGEGEAIHVHALISGNFDYVDSGRMTTKGLKFPRTIPPERQAEYLANGWQIVYNMPQWKMGWSTAIELYGEPEAFCHYIMKYITKENKMIFGNYYWAGGGIRREPDIQLTDTDYKALDAKEYYIEQAHCGFKYMNVNSEGEVF